MKRTNFDVLKIETKNMALIWKNVHGLASEDVADKLDDAMLKWQVELTGTLEIWINKGLAMNDGELILARANLGAVVEAWLKFFYCVYYEDYCREPITSRNGKMVEPEDMSFEKLKEFSTGKLWEDKNSLEYVWVDSVQHKRNAIHSFKYREIGTAQEFLDDVDYLCEFADNILMSLPPLEDYIDVYPAGYEMNVHFE